MFAENPVQIAALIKKFLRELPDPLLTYKLHGLFTCALEIKDPVARRRVFHLACCMLPRTHRDTLEVLFLFIQWVATHDANSLMDTANLARVLAPNILSSKTKDPVKDDSFKAIRVVEELLDSFEELCTVPDDIEPFLHDHTLNNADINKDIQRKLEHLMSASKEQ